MKNDWLGQIFKMDSKNFISSIVFASVTALDGILMPAAIGMLTDALTVRNGNRALSVVAFSLAGMMIISTGGLLWQYFNAKIRMNINTKLKSLVFDRAINHPMTGKPSEYLSVTLNDVKQVETRVVNNLGMFFFCIIQATITGVFLLVINWKVSLIFLILSLAPSIVPPLFKKNLKVSTAEWSRKNSEYTRKLEEGLQARLLFTRYQADQEERNKVFKKLFAAEKAYFKMNMSQQLSSFSVNMVYDVAMMLSLGIGVLFVLRGSINVGVLITIYMAADRFASPVVSAAGLYNQIFMNETLVNKILVSSEDDRLHPKYENVYNQDNLFELMDVSFGYDNHNVLEGATFTIPKNKRTLIVGESGSGKSTLIKLLMGELSLVEGKMAIQDSGKSLVASLAIIEQQPFIFDDSLKFNLTLGKRVEPNRISEVINKVGLGSWYKGLGNIDQDLGTLGDKISGGQKKRLEIARALLYNKENLIVDEGLSSLDENNAKEIHKLIMEFPGTVIDIEHRVSKNDVEDYDQVIVLAQKHISVFNKDSYPELLRSKLFI